MVNRKIIISIVVIVIIVILGILYFKSPIEESSDSSQQTTSFSESLWINAELINIKTKESFTISQYDKPVILESFAVWCPTCKKQQDQIKKLIEQGDDSIHISLDTDPNEDETKVIEHKDRYNFDWIFAISPVEVTQSLIDDFGISIVNAPGAPMVIVCPDKSARLLRRGVKSASELKLEIDKC